MCEERAPISGVDGHVHGADVTQREKHAQRLGAIWQPDHHVFALPNSDLMEGSGRTADKRVHFQIRPLASVLETHERLRRPLTRMPIENVAQDTAVRRGNTWVGFHSEVLQSRGHSAYECEI